MAFVAAMDTTTTENGALAYNSTQNPFLDMFFQLVRSTTSEGMKEMIGKISRDKSFVYDGKEYFNNDFFNRMLVYTRNVRGGVGERDLAYYMMMYLLSEEDFQSVDVLLPYFGHFGYWKDYMNMIKMAKEDKTFNINEGSAHNFIRRVVNFYCDALKTDLDKVVAASGDEKPSISLAAKWCPSDRDAIDKKYHILDKFAFRMASLMGWETNDKTPTYYVRGLFRKQVISPLRKVIKVVETHMCEKEWSAINYEAVPSKAMVRYTKAFNKNDGVRFNDYKMGLVKGEKKVNFEAVYPHEIMNEYVNSYHPSLNEVAEAQMDGWRNKLMEMGKFGNAVSVVDVSGSMNGEPMEVAVSLGVLIASVANEPFRDTVITFDERPRFYNFGNENNWFGKVKRLMKAPWGMNTDFSAVFNLILSRAQTVGLSQSDMPERIYVFSDMQFDEADSGYHTHFESIKKKYEDAGYTLPQLIFWNLRSSSTNPNYPVTLLNTNVALLSGFSPAIIKAVLEVSDLSPMAVMIKAIMDPIYDVIESVN